MRSVLIRCPGMNISKGFTIDEQRTHTKTGKNNCLVYLKRLLKEWYTIDLHTCMIMKYYGNCAHNHNAGRSLCRRHQNVAILPVNTRKGFATCAIGYQFSSDDCWLLTACELLKLGETQSNIDERFKRDQSILPLLSLVRLIPFDV